jgi:hypothetical protein
MDLLGHVCVGIDSHIPIPCLSYQEMGYDDTMEDVRRVLDRCCRIDRSSIPEHYVNWSHPVRQTQAHLSRRRSD